jgi:hypothetical protein
MDLSCEVSLIWLPIYARFLHESQGGLGVHASTTDSQRFFATDTMVEGARMIHTEIKSLMLDCLMFSRGFLGDFGGSCGACLVHAIVAGYMGVEEVRKNTHRSDESLCNT